jgi:hypothetical protein
MWPFCKKVVDCNVPEVEDKPKLFKFQITYNDNTTRNIVANEFNWNRYDIIFTKNDIGIFWVRTSLIQTIENCGEEPTKVSPEL